MYSVTRYHDFSYGHRVVNHESKCKNLHGHNGRVYFTVIGKYLDGLDDVGRVIDFEAIKTKLCQWLEDNWDHKFLAYVADPKSYVDFYDEGVVMVPFNPTAENMARYLVEVVGPSVLPQGVILKRVDFWETRKCYATYSKKL